MNSRHKTLGFTTQHAAILKSSLVSEIRGSIGGTTYARNKAGLYARNRSKPVNPNTVNQSRVRSQFQTNAYGFSLLTAEQVAAWNQFAQGYPAVNRVGDTYTPSGKQVYMLCNQNLLSIGESVISVPPYDVPVVPNLDAVTPDFGITNTAGAITVFKLGNMNSDLATAIVIVQATPNMQPARQSYRNRMRQMAYGLQGTDINLEPPWNAYFGNPAVIAGQIINVRVSAVDPATGVAGAWLYLQVPVPVAA